MPTILDKIVASRKKTLLNEKADCSRKKKILPFSKAILERKFIFEIKKKSPGAGFIKDIDPVKQALIYQNSGCAAISVLTEPEFFGGSLSDLKKVSETVSVPVLCKDFIVSEKQIENAYKCGADAVLLIAAVLSREELKNLSDYAKKFGLEILFEIHSLEEFEKIEFLNPSIVGVNSRNLKTMKIDLNRCGEILSRLPRGFVKIAESGIKSRKDAVKLEKAGANGFLIGTSVVKAENPEKFIKELIYG